MSSTTRNLRVKAPIKYTFDDEDSDNDEKSAPVAKKASTRPPSKAKPIPAAKLSEYEKIRLKNIQNNKKYLDKMKQAARLAKSSSKPIQEQVLDLVSLHMFKMD